MGFFKKVANTISKVNPLTNAAGFSGQDTSTAILSGIPIFGDGFAQQDAQNFSAQQVLQQHAFQKQQNQKAMDFSERMSNTAYQREVKDLEASGLNRILAVGGGASAPQGVSSAGSAASGTPKSGSSQATDLVKMLAKKEAQLAEKNLDFMDQRTREASSSADLNDAHQELARQKARLTKAQAGKEEVTKSLYDVAAPLVEDAKQEGKKYYHSAKDAYDHHRKAKVLKRSKSKFKTKGLK